VAPTQHTVQLTRILRRFALMRALLQRNKSRSETWCAALVRGYVTFVR